ncbi:hypothetical protein, partial [Sinomonas humi]|uniref:hypothetical protein n=1 Tax=Sinomonas humi TaxID=1338436 RepID=UPI001E427073
VLSTPPAFILSQDQTLRQKKRKTKRKPARPEKTHQKPDPSQNHPTHTGVRAEQHQPIKKNGIESNMAHY